MFVLNFIVLQIDIILVQTIMQNKQVKLFPQYCPLKQYELQFFYYENVIFYLNDKTIMVFKFLFVKFL